MSKSNNNNRQNKTPDNCDLSDFFNSPKSPRQKQYEALRSIIIDKQSVETAANRFGYKKSSLYSLIRDAKAGKIKLFPEINKGPKRRRTPDEIQNKIIEFRNSGLSTMDIASDLQKQNIKISARTVERIVKEAGFNKLQRRTNKELGKTVDNKIMPERSAHLDFSELEKFSLDCPVAGVFFFIPYILLNPVFWMF